MSLPQDAVQIVASQDTSNLVDIVTGSKIPASTSTPEALASAGTYVATVTIFAGRANRVANNNSVYIDFTSGDGTQQIEIPVGGFSAIDIPVGKYLDMANVYVDSLVAGDGVYWRGFR
jgi:hypothetical protein